eukprot:TRINITY_DN5136_c0_g1_i1.p1 TRINITY_DN5136_c0_g1~~TRINITY_DN5136_c0_g1_i1.p1  ORF type:complete len:394 (-),score=77.90 TRINITY_DN5136_c0_g1_i1:4-1116(-)
MYPSGKSASSPNGRNVFDFRSDTVTVPTPEMLQVMISAPVGDDVREEDPTVNQLQEKVAALCGKEAGLFVCSGVMANQLAIRTHVTNNFYKKTVSQSILLDPRSHVFSHELGGLAAHSGIQAKLLEMGKSKHLTAELLEKNIDQVNDYHTSATTIISLENTLNGDVFPIEEIKLIRKVADKYDLRMHCDGARIWNASVATGIELKEYGKYFDSISLCLSKGLGAPLGSILVGTKDFIAKARQYRKMFGGGMRQIGNIAACGIYAIDNNWQKMKVDHENTKVLHDGLVKLGFDVTTPETNMVFVNSEKLGVTFERITEAIAKLNTQSEPKILIDGSKFDSRLVVHFQTPLEAIQKLLQVLETALKETKEPK